MTTSVVSWPRWRFSPAAGPWTPPRACALRGSLAASVATVLAIAGRPSPCSSCNAARGTGTRYRMLETVRLFAQHKLVEMDLAEHVRAAHRDWFVRWVQMTPMDQRLWYLPWIPRCADARQPRSAAFEWSMDHAGPGAGGDPAGVDHGHAAGARAGKRAGVSLRLSVLLFLEVELEPPDRVAVLAAGLIAALGDSRPRHDGSMGRPSGTAPRMG